MSAGAHSCPRLLQRFVLRPSFGRIDSMSDPQAGSPPNPQDNSKTVSEEMSKQELISLVEEQSRKLHILQMEVTFLTFAVMHNNYFFSKRGGDSADQFDGAKSFAQTIYLNSLAERKNLLPAECAGFVRELIAKEPQRFGLDQAPAVDLISSWLADLSPGSTG